MKNKNKNKKNLSVMFLNLWNNETCENQLLLLSGFFSALSTM